MMAEDTAEIVQEAGEDVVEMVQPTSLDDLERKMMLNGTVKRIEIYGAFVDIGVGTNAILHISKLDQRVNRIADVLSVGDEVTVWVESVDADREQIMVTMKPPLAVEWSDLKIGQTYLGKVTRLERFGAFVDIGAEKEGLVHVSELSHDYVNHPSEAVKVGDETEVMVLGFSKKKRRIDLSRKSLIESPDAVVVEVEEEEINEEEILPTSMEIAIRRAMGKQSKSAGGKKSPKSGTRKSQGKQKQQQEDILSRTLKLSQENGE